MDGIALERSQAVPVRRWSVPARITSNTRSGSRAYVGTEPVKEFETIRQPFFCASFPIVGLLIHATVGSFGGDGRRWRNRAGLAA